MLTHVDVFPAGKDQTIELLKQLADASRKESGNLRFDVLQQEGRLNHLPLVEACVRQVDLEGGRIVIAAGFADPE